MESFKRYAYHLDKIRRQKNMTVKDLCADIVNERTYRRYLTGDRNLSQEKILLFCRRLEMSPIDFYQTFVEKDRYEFKTLYKLYSYLGLKKYDEFIEGYQKIQYETLINIMNQRFYTYLNVRYLYNTNRISMFTAEEKYREIINFPECENNTFFDFSDILVLSALSSIETKREESDFKATYVLEKILLDDSIRYVTSDANQILPTIYSSVAMAFGKMGELETCKDLCKKGIELSLHLGRNLALTNLYFANAITLNKMGRTEEAHEEIVKCLANTITLQNYELFSYYRKVFIKIMDIDGNELFPIFLDSKK